MARGFGATLGIGTGDRVVTGLTVVPTAISVGCWAYRNGDGGDGHGAMLETAGERVILGNDTTNTAYRFYRVWSGTDGWWHCARPATGGWHHFLATYDGSATTNNPTLYVNGSSSAVTQFVGDPTGTVDTTASAYWMGNRVSDSSKSWDGALAELAVWNRVLTAAEALEIGAQYRSPAFYQNGLLDYVPLNTMIYSEFRPGVTPSGTKPYPHPPGIIYPEGTRWTGHRVGRGILV